MDSASNSDGDRSKFPNSCSNNDNQKEGEQSGRDSDIANQNNYNSVRDANSLRDTRSDGIVSENFTEELQKVNNYFMYCVVFKSLPVC